MNKSFKRAIKIVFLVVLIAIIAVPAYILTNKIPIERSNDLNNYDTHRQSLWLADRFMPELAALVDATEIRYGYQTTNNALWLSKTMALTVQYPSTTYEHTKAEILASNEFISAPELTTGANSGDYIVDDSFEHKGYTFHTLAGHDGCKHFGMIGLNDTARSVAYLYYSDSDRDYLAETDADLDQKMRDLINKEFNWQPF